MQKVAYHLRSYQHYKNFYRSQSLLNRLKVQSKLQSKLQSRLQSRLQSKLQSKDGLRPLQDSYHLRNILEAKDQRHHSYQKLKKKQQDTFQSGSSQLCVNGHYQFHFVYFGNSEHPNSTFGLFKFFNLYKFYNQLSFITNGP